MANTMVKGETTFQVIVTRCGCDKPLSHLDAACPTPREVIDHGIVARILPEEKP